MPTVSVAMATYNGVRFLTEQLDSIRLQTRAANEVIIVDDASIDETPKMVCEYIKKYELTHWRFYPRETNQGYKKTFSEALGYTTGEIILFSDQDDIWMLEKIEIIVDCLIKNPKIKALGTELEWVNSNGASCAAVAKCRNPVYTHTPINGLAQNHWKDQLLYNSFNGCVMAFTRNLIPIFFSIPNNTQSHDVTINLIAAFDESHYFLNVPTIKFRRHETNTSRIYANRSPEGRIRFCEARLLSENSTLNVVKNIPMLDEEIRKQAIRILQNKIKILERSVNVIRNKDIKDAFLLLFFTIINRGRLVRLRHSVADIFYAFFFPLLPLHYRERIMNSTKKI